MNYEILFKNWMFNFVSLLKYKRQMTANKLCKHSILIIIELYKLVRFLSLLSPVSARVNRFEWPIDITNDTK